MPTPAVTPTPTPAANTPASTAGSTYGIDYGSVIDSYIAPAAAPYSVPTAGNVPYYGGNAAATVPTGVTIPTFDYDFNSFGFDSWDPLSTPTVSTPAASIGGDNSPISTFAANNDLFLSGLSESTSGMTMQNFGPSNQLSSNPMIAAAQQARLAFPNDPAMQRLIVQQQGEANTATAGNETSTALGVEGWVAIGTLGLGAISLFLNYEAQQDLIERQEEANNPLTQAANIIAYNNALAAAGFDRFGDPVDANSGGGGGGGAAGGGINTSNTTNPFLT